MRLFAFGSNGSGQLGIGHQEDVAHPTQCLFEKPKTQETEPRQTTQDLSDEIVKITAGGNHTLLLTKSGAVYAAGCDTDGRCGPHQEDEILVFRRLILPNTLSGKIETFKHVSATWEGSILVSSETEGDRIFVLGSNPKGELGLAADASISPGTSIPNFPPDKTRITALASGMAHSAAVLCNGDVYGWGAARKGQLGVGSKAEKVAYEPVKVDVPFFAESVVCGREFTVVSGKGEFIVLGDPGNRWGVLQVPSLLSSQGEVQGGDSQDRYGCEGSRGFVRYPYTGIGASWHGIYVHAAPGLELDSVLGGPSSHPQVNNTGSGSGSGSGSFIAWGRNDRGQLPPSKLPTPAMVAVGSEHVLALLGDGQVAAFGWGEHGNCGPDTDQQGNVSGTYNVVSLPGTLTDRKIVGLGAGCATSWIVVT
jgi:protein ATS1